MANSTRFLIELPDEGADSDQWGTILNNAFSQLEQKVTDKTAGDTVNGALVVTGALSGNTVSGNGANLTNLNATNIATGTLANARTTATSANTANAIVARDANGDFSAHIITSLGRIVVTSNLQDTAVFSSTVDSLVTSQSSSGYGALRASSAAGMPAYMFFNSGNVERARLTASPSGGLNFGANAAATTFFNYDATANFSRVIPGGTTLYPDFACRAWVNFNGTTGAVRASGNVTSVTRNQPGDYTVNFSTAMPDANYSVSGMCNTDNDSIQTTLQLFSAGNTSTTSQRVILIREGVGRADFTFVNFMLVR